MAWSRRKPACCPLSDAVKAAAGPGGDGADFSAGPRLILAHKQRTSARLRFLLFSHGLTAFAPLPALSTLDEADARESTLAYHPVAWLRAAETRLGLPAGSLKLETEFDATVSTPDGPVVVLLASLETIDPPFAEAAALDARFIAITEARGRPPVELELLRRAYACLLGG